MKLIDCFMFFDEDLILEIRLNTLYDVCSWANQEGSVEHPGSMVGSLLRLMGTEPRPHIDGWHDLLRFANISPEDFAD